MKQSLQWQEYQPLEQVSPSQVEAPGVKSTLWRTVGNVWEFLKHAIVASDELRVWYSRDRDGRIWWNAYNPKTEQSISRVSEEQMRIWIEQTYR